MRYLNRLYNLSNIISIPHKLEINQYKCKEPMKYIAPKIKKYVSRNMKLCLQQLQLILQVYEHQISFLRRNNILFLYIYVVLRIRWRWNLIQQLVSFTFHELVNFFAIRIIYFDRQHLHNINMLKDSVPYGEL